MTTSALDRYGRVLNTHDLLKILATIFMIIDHVGHYVWYDKYLWCRLLGRAAAPLFFFLIGYSGKIRLRPILFVYAIILTLSGSLVYHNIWINILVNFIIIDCVLRLCPAQSLDTFQRMGGFIAALFINLLVYSNLEYGTLGLLLAYSARLLALGDRQAKVWLVLSLLAFFIWEMYGFHFNRHPSYMIAFIALILGLFMIMQSYSLKNLACPRWLLLPGLIISRYSLEIYFYHLLFFHIYIYCKLYKPFSPGK